MPELKVSRRQFLKTTGIGAGAAVATLGGIQPEAAAAPETDHAAVVAAMGDTLIPSEPGDAGYMTLQPYNITAEVLKGLAVSDQDLALFDDRAQGIFPGKRFVQLDASERQAYFDAVFSGERFDKESGAKLQQTLRRVRQRVFEVFYSNYPEHALARDSQGIPVLPAGDKHQITNPNSKALVTGWDIAGFRGPLTWEEEERRRQLLKKIDWRE
ncbi:MAG: twin-arginine translocation signal domain-containing protein [Acidobacteria bacterium]|nr:twin-arginine translocation signal domain-containing protein [Acidobacteriota bacterium]